MSFNKHYIDDCLLRIYGFTVSADGTGLAYNAWLMRGDSGADVHLAGPWGDKEAARQCGIVNLIGKIERGEVKRLEAIPREEAEDMSAQQKPDSTWKSGPTLDKPSEGMNEHVPAYITISRREYSGLLKVWHSAVKAFSRDPQEVPTAELLAQRMFDYQNQKAVAERKQQP